MKKFMYLGAAALAGLFATSCASDEPAAGTTDGMTTFTVQMPEDLTRDFADGTSATNLFVAIYDAGADKETATPLFCNFTGAENNFAQNPTDAGMRITSAGVGSKKWTVSVNLVKNKAYDIVFWAQNPNATNAAPYTFDAAKRTITVDYANMANYAEGRDAFYKHVTYTSTTPDQQNIKLTRAFAQINIGTTDADLKDYKTAGGVNKFAMSIEGVSNVLNLFSDKVDGSATVNTTAMPATVQGETGAREQLGIKHNEKVSYFDYLAMAYVLVGGTETTRANLTVSLYNQDITETAEAFATYENVPAQMNYRTNIFGNLLTNPEVFNVVIDNEFLTPDFNVTDASQLAAALQAGGNITLTTDIVATTPQSFTVPAGKEATINLNGHNINCYGFIVKGNLTINGNGNVTQTSGLGDALVWANGSNAKVTINGGNFKAGTDPDGDTNSCIYASSLGNITITGGEFKCTREYSKNGLWYVLNVSNKSKGSITVSGGTFYNFNPANGDDKLGGEYIKVAEGYKSVETAAGSNVWQVVAE